MIQELIDEMSLTVSQLNDYVAELFDADELLSGVLVTGEISNFKLHSSGHMYFTLKDENASIRCVMFRQYAGGIGFLPKDGMKVRVGGRVSLYKKEGQYQLYAQAMDQQGKGALYLAFEQLKNRLQEEGLFEQARKKKLPLLPQRVAVVTSPTGAVIRDILHVSTRRDPKCNILLYPVRVQGESAAQEIAQALKQADEKEGIDVIILARGGGSLEDLWPFNTEEVARAIAACKTPVVSAVGHETDFSISDFVSDLRAPTPSAAAEMVFPVFSDLEDTVASYGAYLSERMEKRMAEFELRLDAAGRSAGLYKIRSRMEQEKTTVGHFAQRLESGMEEKLSRMKLRLEKDATALSAFSPRGILSRGYAYVTDEMSGRPVTAAQQSMMGQQVKVHFQDGAAQAIFTGVTEQETEEGC